MFDLALKLFFGFTVGVIQVGTSVQRTLFVDKGNVAMAAATSLVNTVAFFICTYYVAKDDLVSYAASGVGALVVCVYLAIKNRGQK